MKRVLWLVMLLCLPVVAFSQTMLQGKVTDNSTGEALIGANVLVGPAVGTITDLDGNYTLKLPPGKYRVRVSYVGYETDSLDIIIGNTPVKADFKLFTLTIDEVVIVADVAIARETPVAFSNISPAKIDEELAGRDLPMVLNTTPGVYATQQGGGDGDARITIRGFDQRNLAVMIDGIPVNDMENGWVYWSNWFGLDLVTRSMQVQRGLGASQLALPSVGGTINILTKGIDNKPQLTLKQEIDAMGKIRSSFGYTSGKLKNGWGLTLAGSYKRGNGWVDNTFSEGWFYYAKVDKRYKKHLFTASAMGAPQHHDQRSYKRPVTAYDTTYAKSIGIDLSEIMAVSDKYELFNLGTQYNQHWGVLKRDRYDANAPEETLSEKTNVYHKPQFTLRDFWTVSDRFSVSNNLYLSIGKGGGDGTFHSIKDSQIIQDPDDPNYGQIDWQAIYDSNCKPIPPLGILPININYSPTLFVASNFMERQHNEHFWYGLLSKFMFKATDKLDLSGGLDLRSYKGVHFSTVTDLLGADYAIDKADETIDYVANPDAAMKYVGDTIDYYYDGLVRWGGLFVQGEYKTGDISSFVNLTSALSGYNKIDYFTATESGWIYKPGFTVKSGVNYNLSATSNFFMNLGYLSKVKAYRYFYQGYTTAFAKDLDNEIIRAIEFGYTYSSSLLSARFNAYYTTWENKPTNRVYSTYVLQEGDPNYVPDDPEANSVRVYADIPGMDARHMGVELDFVYKLTADLELQGTVSFGDWIWNSYIDSLQYYLDDGNNPAVNKIVSFDARGIHVGDAAQTQLGSSIRYEPVDWFYINLRQTYYAKYYSNFTPEATTDADGNVVDSWKMPNFNLFDLHAGFSLNMDKFKVNIKLSMLNVLNTTYIWDATNNDSYSPYSSYFQDFDAKSATVFFGTGRTFTTSVMFIF